VIPAKPTRTPFCLKIVNPNYELTDYFITSTGANFLFRAATETTWPVAIFTIDETGHLVTPTGYILAITSPFNEAQSVRPISPTIVVKRTGHPLQYAVEVCSISEQNTLECKAQNGDVHYVNFARLGTADFLTATIDTVDTANLVILQLGVFYGSDCVR
jgi:hypothetical protein